MNLPTIKDGSGSGSDRMEPQGTQNQNPNLKTKTKTKTVLGRGCRAAACGAPRSRLGNAPPSVTSRGEGGVTHGSRERRRVRSAFFLSRDVGGGVAVGHAGTGEDKRQRKFPLI
ncbi:phycobilisome 32.1 kDa linker polypeptide [Striga asiatica]|uniref:Phycobilisome 32.1 kDa linker polypeptide n=1 Tax=Striga asiatica TaxID=4170 RepID=A0A5A7NWH2_STRAF|nr:phycobilisome 32.1 kDa linker polypeptide [Striga asiatica]